MNMGKSTYYIVLSLSSCDSITCMFSDQILLCIKTDSNKKIHQTEVDQCTCFILHVFFLLHVSYNYAWETREIEYLRNDIKTNSKEESEKQWSSKTTCFILTPMPFRNRTTIVPFCFYPSYQFNHNRAKHHSLLWSDVQTKIRMITKEPN